MEPKSIVTALELTEKATKALRSLREQAKTSKDANLKDNISNLYDHVLDLKEIVLRIKQENEELRRENADLKHQLSHGVEKPSKPEIRQVGTANYYYIGDDGPYCQPCFVKNGRLVNLTAQQQFGSFLGRECQVCKERFMEERASSQPRARMRVKPYGY